MAAAPSSTSVVAGTVASIASAIGDGAAQTVGATNLRGSVVPSLDLRQMIGLATDTALKYAVVVKHGNWQVGVLVDTVPEIRTLSKDQFLPAPVGTADGGNPFVSTVVKLEDRLRGVLETSVV